MGQESRQGLAAFSALEPFIKCSQGLARAEVHLKAPLQKNMCHIHVCITGRGLFLKTTGLMVPFLTGCDGRPLLVARLVVATPPKPERVRFCE